MTKGELIEKVMVLVTVGILFFIIGMQYSTIQKYKTLCSTYDQAISIYHIMIDGYEHALDLQEQVHRIREGGM